MKKTITWEEAKANSDKLTSLIESVLDKNPPKNIAEVLAAVRRVDKDCGALPNPNSEGQYCQLILYPSRKWVTWSSTWMSISKYNLFK